MTTCTTRAAETWARILEQPDGLHMDYAADFARDDGSEPAEACAAVEAVAQQHLDAHPDDHRARRLLGEWLTWHGDVRGEGYVALAAQKLRPHLSQPVQSSRQFDEWLWQLLRRLPYSQDYCTFEESSEALSTWFRLFCPRLFGSWHKTRRDAEDVAAIAFARLPAERRATLLKGEM